MSLDVSSDKDRITRRHSSLLLAASLMTLLLISMGGIVCITESGAACPDWPGCYGRIVPPLQIQPIIEYLHRFIAALTTPLILAATFVGWRQARALRWVSRPPLVSIVFLVAVIIFGALAVLRGLPAGLAAIDLGSALIVAALLLTATVTAFAHRADSKLPDRLSAGTALSRTSWAAVGAVFLVHVTGILTAGKGSLTRCLGWPIWRLIPGDQPGWAQIARLGLALAAAVLIAATIVQARHERAKRAGLFRTASLTGLAFVVEIVTGLLLLAIGSPVFLLVIYVVAAATLWALLVTTAAQAGIAAAAGAQEADHHAANSGRRANVRLNQGEGL